MPTRRPDTDSVESWVAAATAAPSMHNAQPWLFRYTRDSGELLLTMDPERAMPQTDPSTRGLHVGCGAALFNLRVAAAHAGWEARVRPLPDPADRKQLAAVTFAPAGTEDEATALYPAIRRRRTSREPFSDEAVPQAVLDGLSGAARAEGARLTFPGAWQVQAMLDLLRNAEYAEALSPEARDEIARWTGTGTEEETHEGVPSSAFGPRRYGGAAPVRDFAGDRPVEGRRSAVFEHSPCLAVLGTREDGPQDWLRAGQAMERVLLQATLDGLSTSLNSQALEWPELRWAMRDPLSPTGYPQMLLRLGYGPDVPPTPRRPVSDVLDVV
ncbi:Acg family FMN-binding oxidoreductase [Streptomyces katrae]|uniref:Acg family FMN-binding oxidoreductase n=1 Tax=Streptomyces katrae TaxID=68223 RepID=UPI0004C2AAC4|nr:nitroreductase [Streptomyces katrae]